MMGMYNTIKYLKLLPWIINPQDLKFQDQAPTRTWSKLPDNLTFQNPPSVEG